MTQPQPIASKIPAGSQPAPKALTGVWRREVIFNPSGHRDATTQVFWLQTDRFYADIRIPADRPQGRGASGFQDYRDDELIGLAAMQGFAGVLTTSADVCLWRRDLDYQPPDPAPDEARFEVEGDRMSEFGIHAEYTEIWRREPMSQAPLAAFRRDAGEPGMLVIGGDHFIEIRGRASPLPSGANLAEIVRRYLREGQRDLAIRALQMPISYGQVAGGAVPWCVRLSTLPWLEGGPLLSETARFDPATGFLESGADRWTLLDATCPPITLAQIFDPVPGPQSRA